MPRQLLYHLISAGEERRRDLQPYGARGTPVYRQGHIARRIEGQIGDLGAAILVVFAALAWITGRACRYVLEGR
jgi:hypothetical protein